MPRGKKSTVKVETVEVIEPVVNEAETEAEEVKTTVEVTANPESTEFDNVTITRDENGEVISVQPTQELIDQQNTDVGEEEEEEKPEEETEKKTEETEKKTEETEAENVENPVNENELFLNNDSSEVTELQKDNSAETETQEESTTEPLTPTAANRGIASQIITDPYGRRSVGYQPNPSKAVFTKADSQGNASVTVFGRRGEERIKRNGTSL